MKTTTLRGKLDGLMSDLKAMESSTKKPKEFRSVYKKDVTKGKFMQLVLNERR